MVCLRQSQANVRAAVLLKHPDKMGCILETAPAANFANQNIDQPGLLEHLRRTVNALGLQAMQKRSPALLKSSVQGSHRDAQPRSNRGGRQPAGRQIFRHAKARLFGQVPQGRLRRIAFVGQRRTQHRPNMVNQHFLLQIICARQIADQLPGQGRDALAPALVAPDHANTGTFCLCKPLG